MTTSLVVTSAASEGLPATSVVVEAVVVTAVVARTWLCIADWSAAAELVVCRQPEASPVVVAVAGPEPGPGLAPELVPEVSEIYIYSE